ncbi:MAG: uracil-DNA glycosylase [Pirellulales bacterium]
MTEDRERLRRAVLGRLESLERAGVQQLPKGQLRAVASETAAVIGAPVEVIKTEPQLVIASSPAIDSRQPKEETTMARSSAWARVGAGLFEATGESSVPTSSAATLAVLQQEVAPCTRCGELAATRTQTVFGVGNPQARLCFLGEAPGADEDRLGEPFVGRGGQLLNKIIEACRLKREDVYILNMLKCRPPGNRNPLPGELTNCRPFLERQLELIQPEYICCLGAVASQNLLGVTTAIGKLRGKLHAYRGAKVVCTFHPAYLLRNPPAKKDCWDDMKFLMREMGVEL